jgi:iron complex outermembrane receptor protein
MPSARPWKRAPRPAVGKTPASPTTRRPRSPAARAAAYNAVDRRRGPGGAPLSCLADRYTIVGTGTAPTSAAAAGTANNLWHPRIPRYGRLQYDQKRLGVTGSLQWRPTENSTLSLDALVANFTNNRDETYLEVISFSRSGRACPRPTWSTSRPTARVNLIKGTFDDVDARVEYRHDDLKTEFNQFTLTYDTKFGESGHLNVGVRPVALDPGQPGPDDLLVRSLRQRQLQLRLLGQRQAAELQLRLRSDQSGQLRLQRPSNAKGDPSLLRLRPSKAVNTFKTFRADVDYEILDGFKLRYGGDYKEYGFSFLGAAPVLAQPGVHRHHLYRRSRLPLPAGVTIADVSRLITGFGRGLDLPSGVPTSWIAPDLDKLKKVIGYDCNCINANGDFRLSTLNQLGALRSVTEKDTAFYIQGDFDYDLFNIPVRGNSACATSRPSSGDRVTSTPATSRNVMTSRRRSATSPSGRDDAVQTREPRVHQHPAGPEHLGPAARTSSSASPPRR